MKTDLSCLSKLPERIRQSYHRILLAAILAAGALLGAAARADEPLLCVLVPHFKDEYWLSIAYGLEQRSAELGLAIHFFEAGGYNALENQIAQIEACDALDPAAVLIGAVSSDAPDLLAAVETAAAKRPVIGLVNDLRSDALAARVGVDWTDMGLALGQYLAKRFPADSPATEAVLLSGPSESGWVAPLERGLQLGLAESSVAIVGTYRADTGTAEQLRLLERARREHDRIDLVIGTAPAIEAAMALYSADDRPALAATYVSHSVARGLAGNQVLAAPFDDPVGQGRLAVDAAHSALQGTGEERTLRTSITILQKGLAGAVIALSPADYFPRL